ncbi:hypothetical protein [Pseudomonas entomophila]|uniref:Uncharacterized protein n=2 Tax=Pseudomonas entomophila TaxID=312306 RepID=Q1IE94_PSEE4|nr:hypothetical protein [Pseudomonas entomophila]WMW05166.1 hypothetical protein RAH46_23025 [Pseudomonas entomophila]CAK14011.1 hypothetical protein PSEEN1111 [Pseudomonas entomophila L48]
MSKSEKISSIPPVWADNVDLEFDGKPLIAPRLFLERGRAYTLFLKPKTGSTLIGKPVSLKYGDSSDWVVVSPQGERVLAEEGMKWVITGSNNSGQFILRVETPALNDEPLVLVGTLQ